MVWAATAIAAVSVGTSIYQGSKARDAQKDANRAQTAINRYRNNQEIRAFLRNYRQQQANVLAGGVAAGLGIESSAVQGQQSGLRSQAQTSVNDARHLSDLGAEVGRLRSKAADYTFQSGVASTIGSFATNFISTQPKEPGPTENA